MNIYQAHAKNTNTYENKGENMFNKGKRTFTEDSLKALTKNQDDIQFTEITVLSRKAFFIFVNGVIDYTEYWKLAQDLTSSSSDKIHSYDDLMHFFQPFLFNVAHTEKELMTELFDGKIALVLEGKQEALLLNLPSSKTRSFAEPTTERVVRGPKISLIESLSDNIALIRQSTKDQSTVVRKIKTGSEEKKEIAVIYNKNLAKQHLVDEVLSRIEKVKKEDILDSGVLEELIEDTHYTPFPQIQNTERLDKVLASLKEGRVGIIVDGSPFALIAPTKVDMLLQSPDDYYERWIAGSFLRLLRYISVFITVFLSAIYISLVSFNSGMIPTELAMTIAGTRQNVPFPPFIEAIIMELTIELLREAGVRLPTPVGQTIGLVGGVIIGQAAVQANLVSSIMVIIVSITTITSFTVPQYSFGLGFRALRFGAMGVAAILGLYGTTLFFIIFITHLAKLTSFNEPYLDLRQLFNKKKQRDFLIRLPKKAGNN